MTECTPAPAAARVRCPRTAREDCEGSGPERNQPNPVPGGRLDDLPLDVIVLDLRMPRMDWLTFVTNLWKSRPELGDKTIVLSGDPELVAEVRGLALPAERILMKPVDLAVLEERIRDLALGVKR
jgi:DNA-binding NarL/FixJ family response regulator